MLTTAYMQITKILLNFISSYHYTLLVHYVLTLVFVNKIVCCLDTYTLVCITVVTNLDRRIITVLEHTIHASYYHDY